MSKALRTAIEDLPMTHGWHAWHPMYADMSGTPTPCLKEFMMLMQCAHQANEHSKVTNCRAAFESLMRCFNSQGIFQMSSVRSDESHES